MMETAGIALLLGVFILGLIVTYLFSKYVDEMKSGKESDSELRARLRGLEDKLGGKG